nr:AAA family ATPase [Nocardia carnea]
MREDLVQAAVSIQDAGIVCICGYPASGKSSAARFLADRTNAVVLDKDHLAPMLEESVMRRLTNRPFDRDCSEYVEVVAPGIYDSLIKTGFNVARHHPVICDAPFLSTVRAAAAAAVPLSTYLREYVTAEESLPVTTIWIDSPTSQIRQRMITRGAARDNPKLTNWHRYRSSVLESGIREIARTVCDVVIDN